MTKLHGGRVASIEPGSIAEEAGVLPGDVITSINDHTLRDTIDYRFHSAEEEIELVFQRGDEQFVVSIEKDIDEQLGVEFDEELFDGVKTCGNRCIFCFVHQLPRGMRRSLYLKDDDYRLSFLYGNFVTLTNVDESDIERIIDQRLSPLFVSVHTTEPTLRQEMLHGKQSPDVVEQLRTLTDAGITIHSQIVICSGVNDHEHLERTVHELAELHPGVESIGVVPVGLTRHRQTGPKLGVVDPAGAKEIVRGIRKWQSEFRKRFGTRLVWASDELYLASGTKVPSTEAYEGFPQIENGIGLVRLFIDDARKVARILLERLPHPLLVTLVTSALAASLVKEFADKLNHIHNLQVSVVPIVNKFFGESVTVAGLITGSDVRDQLAGRDLGDLVVIPRVMLRDSAFLDDVTVDALSATLGVPVVAVEAKPRALVETLLHYSI